MKYLPYIVLMALTALLMFFIMKGCQEPAPFDNSREQELIGEIDDLKSQNVILKTERDSLLKLPAKIKLKVVKEIKYIDSLIKKDSTYAITEYRRGLQLWNYPIDGGDYLTYREMGIGAKIFQEGYGLQLQVKEYENVIEQDDKIIENLNFQIKGHKDLERMKDDNIEYYKGLYEDESAWYNENWIWLTLGVVVTGGIVAVMGAVK